MKHVTRARAVLKKKWAEANTVAEIGESRGFHVEVIERVQSDRLERDGVVNQDEIVRLLEWEDCHLKNEMTVERAGRAMLLGH